MRVYDAMNALCGRHAFYPQLARDRIDGALSGALVEVDPATGRALAIRRVVVDAEEARRLMTDSDGS
jgi:hypothetical protein